MGRKEGGTKRPPSKGQRVVTVPALPPATHRGDDFSGETSLIGIKNCPECRRVFEETNRSVLENCMHMKCRICFIEHSEGCIQCKNETESERPKKALRSALTSSPSGTSRTSTQVAFPVTISTVIGLNAPPAGKATRSTTLRSAISSNVSTTEPTNHSTYAITSGSSRVIRRPPDPPSPPLQVLPKVRQTYGKSSATRKVSSRGPLPGGAAPVQGHPRLTTISTHTNTDSSNNAAVSKTAGGPSASFQVSKPAHAQAVTNGGSVASRSNNVSNASSGPTRYPVPARVPSTRMPMPSPDAKNEPEPDSILGDLNVETTAPSTENRVNKKKRHPVHIHDHISIVSGDPLLYQCNVCMKKFKTKAHIKYHEFCKNGEKPLKCEQCGQGFIAKSHYEYHIRTHTGERPYVCPTCGKGFNQRGKVTRHMRSHTGEKPFVCQQCGRGFSNAQAMRSHFLIHTGERPFACEFCDKRFTGMTNLKKHVITHTGERPFQCSHCGKSFGLKWTLNLHLRTHFSERPYACDQCSRAFSNSKDLRRHMVIHSGERPFKCWICGTAFGRKDNLDRHQKNTHNQTREVAKQLANEAAAKYLASSTSASSASTSTSLSQTSTPKPATVSKAPTELKPLAAAETNNKVKVLPKSGTPAQTLPATPVQPMASISEKFTSPIKIEGSISNQLAIAKKHSSSRSPSPKTSKMINNPDRVLSTVTTTVVDSNRISPASTTAASSSRASTPTPVINSPRMLPAPTTVNSSQPISAPKSTQQSSSHGSSKSETPPSTRSTRSSSSKFFTTAPTNGTSTKHSTIHPSTSSKFAKIAHSSDNTPNTLPTSSMASSSSKNALKSSISSTENNHGLENQSTATASNGIKRPRSPLTDAVVITAEDSPSSSPTFERENDTDLKSAERSGFTYNTPAESDERGPMEIKIGLLIDLSSLPETGNWEQHVQLIQETVLERMVLDASFNGKFDVAALMWTYKFYHSSYIFPNNKYWLKFLHFNLTEFEDFEANLENEMQNVYGEGPGPNPDFKDNIVQLREALKSMISCLEWVEDIEMGNPELPFNRNIIYAFTRVPRSESDLELFLNNKSSGKSSESFIAALIGSDFYKHLKMNCMAQVKFVDTGYFFPDNDTTFNNVYPFPLQKALSSLGHVGCLAPTLKPYDHGRLGFPSWKTFLKSHMCSAGKLGQTFQGLLNNEITSAVPPNDQTLC